MSKKPSRRGKGASPSPSKVDPTLTSGLRRRFASDVTALFAKFASDAQDILGADSGILNNVLLNDDWSPAREAKIKRDHGRFSKSAVSGDVGGPTDGGSAGGDHGSGADGSAVDRGTTGAGAGANPLHAADQHADSVIGKARRLIGDLVSSLNKATENKPIVGWINSAVKKAGELTASLYSFLEQRYGRAGAITIFASGTVLAWGITLGSAATLGYPIMFPGMGTVSCLPALAIAEAYKRMRGLTGNAITGAPPAQPTPQDDDATGDKGHILPPEKANALGEKLVHSVEEKFGAWVKETAASQAVPRDPQFDDLHHDEADQINAQVGNSWGLLGLLIANAPSASGHPVGEPFKGQSGRWFVVKEEGGKKRVRPSKAPSQETEAGTQGAHDKIKDMLSKGQMSDQDILAMAQHLRTMTHEQLDDLKKRLGVKASGDKYNKAMQLASRALRAADENAKTEPSKGVDDASGRDRAGGGPTGEPAQGDGGQLEASPVRPDGPGPDQERDAHHQPAGDAAADRVPADEHGAGADEPATPAAAERVPADIGEVNQRIDRFAKFFSAKGQHNVAEWMGKLKESVNALGTEGALSSLGPAASPGGKDKEGSPQGGVQYWGVGTEEANWKNMGSFIEAYLGRNGITAVTADTSSPDTPLISALGAPDRYVAGQDFKPQAMHFKNKLDEAKTLPGLEKSADIPEVMGKPVTHLTSEVTAKLDEQYGQGRWIVKCYDDNAAAGYGIFFPQRAAAITSEARNTLWSAGEQLARYGFSLSRDADNKVTGLKHSGGDEYPFGSEKYTSTIHGDVRHWGDRAHSASVNENGAMLPEGSFMVQPAFAAVGISDAERAAGKTWHEKNEGRVHLLTRPDGSVEVIPHSTWLKGGNLPVVFEDDDTRAMAAAAKAAIEKIPHEARKGQVYAPDIMKTADGYSVVELNAQGDNNGSGYLHDNHFTIDSYVSHITGREPQHVSFIRKLLTKKAPTTKDKGGA